MTPNHLLPPLRRRRVRVLHPGLHHRLSAAAHGRHDDGQWRLRGLLHALRLQVAAWRPRDARAAAAVDARHVGGLVFGVVRRAAAARLPHAVAANPQPLPRCSARARLHRVRRGRQPRARRREGLTPPPLSSSSPASASLFRLLPSEPLHLFFVDRTGRLLFKSAYS